MIVMGKRVSESNMKARTFGQWLESKIKESENPIQYREELTEVLKCSRPAITQYMHYGQKPRPHKLNIILEFFQTSEDEQRQVRQLPFKLETAVPTKGQPNPSRPINQPHEFFGHQPLAAVFEKNWNASNPVHLLLHGKKGCGKTSFLNYLRKTQVSSIILRAKQYRPEFNAADWVYINFQQPLNLDQFFEKLLPDSSSSNRDLEVVEWIDRLYQRKDQKPIFILLDHVESGLNTHDIEFWDVLCALAQSDCPIALCATTRYNQYDLVNLANQKVDSATSSFLDRFQCYTMNPLDYNDAVELMRYYGSNPAPMSESEITWAFNQSQGYPILLQSICYTRQMYLSKIKDWQTEWLNQHAPRYPDLLKKH